MCAARLDVGMRLLLSTALAFAALAFAACKDEHDPVAVPFDGVDPKVAQRKPAPAAPAAPSASSSAGGSASGSSSAENQPRLAGTMMACCTALRSIASVTTDPGTKRNYTAAANACETQRQQVADGKVTKAQALSAVRSSLLGEAPGACN